MMGTAIFHPNMVKGCRIKARFTSYEHAAKHARETMTVIFCPCCQGFHHTSRRQDNYLGMTATPDEILEMFR